MPTNITATVRAACLFIVLMGCKKSVPAEPTRIGPTNLVISSVVAADGSGLVNFTATADNAITYEYDFGNGAHQTVANGVADYTYAAVGTNSFTVSVTAKSSAGLPLSKSLTVMVTTQAHEPALFWSEEFNTDGAPDPAKWGYDLGAGGWGNQELEYYTNRRVNSVVQGGVLKINAIKENYEGSAYTSARLLSKGKFEFKYGRAEIRAKLPAGAGTWPAIWMLGANAETAPWPACGELDIMEHLGRTQNTIYGTLHYPGRSGGNADGSTTVISNATEFHIYSVEWSETSVKIYVDNKLFHTTVNSAALPFNHDFFFILNVAMGGNFGGAMDPAVTGATMEVDYIRVYK